MSDLEALFHEREGYVRRGLKNRVAQVDAQIKELGGVEVAADGTGPSIEPPSSDTVETADDDGGKRSRKPRG